jgi:hypothetical protein
MPRQTKLTPDLQQRFLEAIRVGATHHIACDYAGICQATLYFWFAKAEKGRQPYLAFLEQVREVSGIAAVGWLAQIEKAGRDGDWRAVAWKLERRYPEDFGRTIERQEHTGKDGGPLPAMPPLQIILTQATP